MERTPLEGPLSPHGARVATSGGAVDAVEIRFTKTAGRVAGRPAAGLLEVVTIARLIED